MDVDTEQQVPAGAKPNETGGDVDTHGPAAAAAPTAPAAAQKRTGPAPSTSFSTCLPPLSQETIEVVQKMGFDGMTPVQAATIPLFLTNKDVCVEAVTGSGKTLAFVVPAVEMILRRETELKRNQIGVIILTPTRELANQIFGVVSKFAELLDEARPLLLVGGTSVEDCLAAFRKGGAGILVGTPGRVEDMLNNYSVFDARELEALILDEADTLLDMGFAGTLNSIFALLPKQRRTGLFSATQTRETKALARAGLRNPTTVSVAVRSRQQRPATAVDGGKGATGAGTQVTPTSLENFYITCQPEDKLAQLVAFLKDRTNEKVIVFLSTCASVDFFVKVLPQLQAVKSIGITLEGLHGRMVQKKRTAVYQRFLLQEGGVLLCTDVAARGIDIPDVAWIVQYDPPQDPSYFVHRVGRTARAGKQGRSLTLLCPAEDAYIPFLTMRKVPLTEMEMLEGVKSAVVLAQVKEMSRKDRDILEKGTKAFISFIRAYKEHQCSFIFRFNDLDLAAVARSFCLLRLPKIAELADPKVAESFEKERSLDFTSIKYADKVREKARQKQLVRQEAENKQRALEEEQEAERATQEIAAGNGTKISKPAAAKEEDGRRKRKGRHQQLLEEWDDLATEERLYKKLRNKKLTEDQYEHELRKKSGYHGDSDNTSDADSNSDPDPNSTNITDKKALRLRPSSDESASTNQSHSGSGGSNNNNNKWKGSTGKTGPGGRSKAWGSTKGGGKGTGGRGGRGGKRGGRGGGRGRGRSSGGRGSSSVAGSQRGGGGGGSGGGGGGGSGGGRGAGGR